MSDHKDPRVTRTVVGIKSALVTAKFDTYCTGLKHLCGLEQKEQGPYAPQGSRKLRK